MEKDGELNDTTWIKTQMDKQHLEIRRSLGLDREAEGKTMNQNNLPDPLYVEFLELKCASLEEEKTFFEEQLIEARSEETKFRQALEQIVNESFDNGEKKSREVASLALKENE